MGDRPLPAAVLTRSGERPVGTGGAGHTDVAAELNRVRLESDTLYAIIGVVASSPDVDRVLGGVVDLLTEATACHACFVYMRDGDRLVMRAASRVYSHLAGRIVLGLDEGLTGWVARHKTPAFIPDEALSDPRMKYCPSSRRSASSRWSPCQYAPARARCSA